MSDIKISELPEVGSLISTDITPFVASGTTSKIRLSNLANTMPNVPSATSSSYSLTSSYSNYAVTSSVASRILGGVANYVPIWYTDTTLDSSQLYQLSNNIIIGGTTNPDNYKLYVIGSAKFTNGLNITGSVKINNLSEVSQTNIVNYNTSTGQLYYQNTGSFTASYSISSSYAQTASYSLSSSQAITASFITATNVWGLFGSNSILSASNASTASYVLNAISASYATTASYALTASNILGGTKNYIPLWNTNTSLSNSNIYQSGSNNIILINRTTQYAPGVIPESKLTVDGKILALEGIQIVGNEYPVPIISASRTDNSQYGTLTYNGWGDFSFNKSLLIGYNPQSFAYGNGYLYVSSGIGINKTGSNASLDVNGNAIITGSLSVTNLSNISQPNFVAYNTSTGQFTYASTSSFTAATASFVTASNVWGPFGRNSIISASYSVSSSYALTSSNILGGTNNYVTKWTSPTSLGSSVIYDDGTNVGIGMLADNNYKLLVSGPVKINLGGPSFRVLNNGGSAALYGGYTDPVLYPNSYFARADGANSVFKIPGSGGTMYFEGVSGFKMALSENGNFSIGTTADDGYRLDVDGSVRFKNGLIVTGSGIFNSLSLGTNPINVTTGYGNYISTVTYPIATEASTFWIKIISIDSFPQRIKLFIQAGSDNTLAYDEFEIATSGYGMPHHILRKPTNRYNESKIVGILTSNLLNTAIQEVWINVLGTADSNSYLPYIFMYSNVSLESLANMQASRTTTKPTKANGGTELIINNDKRTDYTIQTSAGAEFNGPVAVSGSLNAVNGVTGSLLGTASYALNAVSSSYALTSSYSVSSSYAQTASFVTASNIFGPFDRNSILSASYSVSSSNATTASYVVTAQTASYILNAVSASYSISASNSQTASYILNAQTASYVTTAQTASYVLNAVSASYSITSSYATTASNVLGGTTNFVTKWNTNTSLASSLIYDNGTNIGIGTTSPDSLLLLEKANINNVSLFKIKAHNGPTPSTAFDITYLNDAGVATVSYYGGNQSKIVLDGGNDNAGGNILIYSGSGELTTRIHGTSHSWLNSGSGNVGIGTNTPAYKLDVSGSLRSNNQVLFSGLSNISKSNIIGFDPNNGQLYYQTTSSLLPNTASYSITSSLALNNIITASADSTYLYFTKGNGSTFNVSFPTVGTATNADTASFVTASNVYGPFGSNSIISSSYSISSSNAQTASYITTAQTASFITASNVWGPFGRNSIVSASYASSSLSASYALTASYILGGVGSTPTLQQVTNQGSSTTVSTNFNGGLIVSSSLKVTGSLFLSASINVYSSSLTSTTGETNILAYNTASGKISYQSIASLGVDGGKYLPTTNTLTNISSLTMKSANYMGVFGGVYTVSGIFYMTPTNQNTVTSFKMTTPTDNVMGYFINEEDAAGTAYFHSGSVQSGLRVYADVNSNYVKISYYNTTAQTPVTCSFIFTYNYYTP